MITKICLVCKKKFSVKKYRKNTAKYCSVVCKNASLIGIVPEHALSKLRGKPAWNKGMKFPQFSGKNHPNYKGGHLRKDGYKIISVGGRLEYEHRQIFKEKGRPLNFNLVVHHKNGDKSDNREGNLEILSRAEHFKIHNIRSFRTYVP